MLTKDMSVARLRLEAHTAYLDGRVKRARELSRLADKAEREQRKVA